MRSKVIISTNKISAKEGTRYGTSYFNVIIPRILIRRAPLLPFIKLQNSNTCNNWTYNYEKM